MHHDIYEHIDAKLTKYENNGQETDLHRKAHFSDLFRLLVLYKYGGMYTDIDSIWVNGKSLLGTNFLVVNEKSQIMNGCMGFSQPRHPLLKYIINDIKRTYNPHDWTSLGETLITKHYPKHKDGITIIDHLTMYGIHWKRILRKQYRDKDDYKIIDKLKKGEIYQIHVFGKVFGVDDFPENSLHKQAYDLAMQN